MCCKCFNDFGKSTLFFVKECTLISKSSGVSHLIKQLKVERFSLCLCLVTVPSSSIIT